MPLVTSLLAAGVLASTLAADPPAATSVTIYSSADPAGFDPQRYVEQQRNGWTPNAAWQVPGFGVVKQMRKFELQAGRNTVSFTDVAAFLDPTTVSFIDMTDSKASVLEQSFQFDLVSPSKLLEKYLDKRIRALVPMGDDVVVREGVLLSANQGSLVIRTKDGIEMVSAQGASISLAELPEGFLTRPTLVWDLMASKGGAHDIRTTYQTAGLTWRADYNLVINADDTQADLTAWVTLLNLSGIAYPDAQLKLIAGDVQRVQPQPMAVRTMARGGAVEMMADAAPGFEEQSFFEYHLYTLPRRTDIASNSTQQLTLFPSVSGATIEKELVYQPTGMAGWGREPWTNQAFVPGGPNKIGVFVSFKNDDANRLGMPLPKGRIRAYKQDPKDGTLEFIGEDLIDHTPRNETVRIKLGDSFDVVGERKIVDFNIDTNRKIMTETVEIEVRNQKDAVQTVVVRENLYRWKTWEIVERNEAFEKTNANTVEWRLKVAPEGKSTVRYTVQYSW